MIRITKHWLFVFLLLETVCVTYTLKFSFLTAIASIIHVISGIAIAFLLLHVPEQKLSFTNSLKKIDAAFAYQLAILLFGGLFTYLFTKQWINQAPLNYVDADMIPIMEVMTQRFMAGNWTAVYDPIQEIWNGIQPIYLPAMWMPFMISIKLDIDPRWVTSFGVFLSFSILIMLWRAHWKQMSGAVLLFVAGVLGLWLYTELSHNFIRLSEEGIVVFYYSLLVLALLSENFLLIGITAALCCLSRYAIAGWLPAILIYLLWIRKQKRDTLRFLFAFAGVCLLLIVLPFGLTPIKIAWQQPAQYMQHAERIWKESPVYFQQSVGLAKFFGPNRIALQHQLLLWLSFLVPVLFVLFYGWKKKQVNLALASLKLSVVIVLALIDVPYQYLFYTSSFVSLIAIAGLGKDKEVL